MDRREATQVATDITKLLIQHQQCANVGTANAWSFTTTDNGEAGKNFAENVIAFHRAMTGYLSSMNN